MSSRLRAAAVAVLLAWALTSCTAEADDPPPATPTGTTSSATSTPAETTPAPPPPETPPPLPPEAQAADDDGAAAFIHYYFDVVNYAYRTGDVDQLEALEADDCKSCTNVNDAIRKGHEDGGSIQGGLITVGDVVATPADPGAAVEVRAVITQARGAFLDASGLQVEPIPEGAEYLFGAVLRYDVAWTLLEWGDADGLL